MITDILIALVKDPGLSGMIIGSLIDPIALIRLLGAGLCVKTMVEGGIGRPALDGIGQIRDDGVLLSHAV